MPKVNLSKNENEPYANGTDDDGNTYYYSSEKKFYLCFTTSGGVGMSKTTKEAREYAIHHKF